MSLCMARLIKALLPDQRVDPAAFQETVNKAFPSHLWSPAAIAHISKLLWEWGGGAKSVFAPLVRTA